MDTWAVLWKWFLILGVGAFAIVSVWVSIAGLSDIRRMFEELRDQQREDSSD